jgi:hypothetical protein
MSRTFDLHRVATNTDLATTRPQVSGGPDVRLYSLVERIGDPGDMTRNRLGIATVAVGIAGLLLPLAACGGDGSGAAGPTGTGSSTGTAGSTSPTAAGSPSVSPPSWPTDDVTVPFPGSVPPVPALTAIRVGSHPEGGFDRISFEFDGLPGYQAGYEPKIVYDGSGEPVNLDGEAYLQLVFNPAQAHDEQGRPILVPAPTKPVRIGYPALVSYVLNGDFEGYVSVALGLSKKLGFNIEQFRQADGDYVIYVDVAWP